MILVDGVAQPSIDASDRGLHYGDGVFETVAVRNGRPQLWQAHLERLAEGCARLDIPLPDAQLLSAELAQLCAAETRAVIKLIVTRGSGGRGYRPPLHASPRRILYRYPWPPHADASAAMSLRLCRTPLGCNPALAGIKHLNRLEQVLARQEWADESVDEGVMTDLHGNLIEGTMSNLFLVSDGELLTPALTTCGVAGVMRRQVLSLAEQLSLPYRVTTLSRADMERADEVFMTNSIIGISAVQRFEGVNYSGTNPVTLRLQRVLQERLESESV